MSVYNLLFHTLYYYKTRFEREAVENFFPQQSIVFLLAVSHKR